MVPVHNFLYFFIFYIYIYISNHWRNILRKGRFSSINIFNIVGDEMMHNSAEQSDTIDFVFLNL